MPSFPRSITWLVRQMYTALIEKKLITKEEVRKLSNSKLCFSKKCFKNQAALICTDLIFTYFLCSAVINPEPLGIISDTPIRWRIFSIVKKLFLFSSYIARFNLMQIGQILQTLAILPYEQRFPAYFGEILSRLNKVKKLRILDLHT